MPDFVVTVTEEEVRVLRRLDPNATARQVLQAHVNTWLAPLVSEIRESDTRDVLAAYKNATPEVKDDVKELLGLG